MTFQAWDTVVRELCERRDKYRDDGRFDSADYIDCLIAQLRDEYIKRY